ncbi:ornithine cyclodeaminase family protein [uncultured Maritimibacter sp.]|uniref:ornithine cyclodeaminase family protein n=1 Tax=uncultured Maritimibacter sp. TaxID=991866 RepID=UPI0025917910|nr:ornithine cyclodeaminase family protein [uncultured Maritimibacter sp.]
MSGTSAELTLGTRFVGGDAVERAFDWGQAIDALRTAYAGDVTEAMFPDRTMARGDGLWLRTLSGIAPDGGLMGAKMIAANIRARRASYLIPLFDQETVELRALLDGNAITGFRTAATTALALDSLGHPGAVRVGLLGTGFEAQNHLRALATIRQITRVDVFSPSPDSRARFVAAVADLGLNVAGCDSADAVVDATPDMLICAARARDEQPLFDGARLAPGMTVASIGSTLPEQREVDVTTLSRAARIVADMPNEVAHDTGDLIAARADEADLSDRIVALADVIGGRIKGRESADEIVLYKSVGGAIQDLAVAAMCFHRAEAMGLGVMLPDTIRPVLK